MTFEHITTNEGLSQDIVTCIAQDSEGFMWFGTEDGLNRYDGYSITIYKNDRLDTSSLSSNYISNLFVDSKGRIWIATRNGLNCYDKDRDSFVRYTHNHIKKNSISNDAIASVCEDAEGTLWVGTAKGLNKFDERTHSFSVCLHDPTDPGSLSSDAIHSVLLDRLGKMWITTNNGLNSLDKASGHFRQYLWDEHPSQYSQFGPLHQDSRGQIWIGGTGGAKRFEPRTGQVVEFHAKPSSLKALAEPMVLAICEDSRRAIWFGLFGGLDIYSPETESFAHYGRNSVRESPLAGQRVYAIFKDRAGAMWVGTWHGGVNRYDPRQTKFEGFAHNPHIPASLSSNEVLSILETRANEIWVGTSGGGLNRGDPNTGTFSHIFSRSADPHTISSNIVTVLHRDRNGILWAGCGENRGTLDRMDSTGRVLQHYPFTNVRTIIEDTNGNLWIGGAGLAWLNAGRTKVSRFTNHPRDADSLHGDQVWSLFEDHDGMLWVGTWGSDMCLNRFDPRTRRFTHYRHDPRDFHSISSDAVRAIFEDSERNLWFGTWGGGLNRYDPSTNAFIHFGENEGLPSLFVKGILSDGRGRLWISTERGLSRFDPAKLEFRNFTTEDGLQGDRFLSGSCCRGRSGRLYFGGENGFNAFFPDSIRDRAIAPLVVITSFKVFDKPVRLPKAISETNEIHLAYGQNFFSFEFAALDYSSPQRNLYAYKMEGFDEDWVQSGTRRYAAYTNLEDGTYTFRVKGSNSDGVWNEAGVSVRIIITPPVWKMWWFRVAIVFIFVCTLFLLYRSRVNKLLANERMRSTIATDLHDDLGTSLTSIALFSDLARREAQGNPQKLNERLDRISETSRMLLDKMNDIVWSVNPDNDSLQETILRMEDLAGRLFEAKGVEYSVSVPRVIYSANLPMTIRRNALLVFKEMVNNVVKHAECTHADITITVKKPVSGKGPGLMIVVRDNGKGFDVMGTRRGNGLRNMKNRAALVDGVLTVESQTGNGTMVQLFVPIKSLN